jgi:hypothetical protein
LKRNIRAKFSHCLLVFGFLLSLVCGLAAPSNGQPGNAAVKAAAANSFFQAKAAAANLTLFRTEQQAQNHCPKDAVVWLNPARGSYHFKGQKPYGNTKGGAYVCEKEAEKAGYRTTQ